MANKWPASLEVAHSWHFSNPFAVSKIVRILKEQKFCAVMKSWIDLFVAKLHIYDVTNVFS